MSDHFDDDSYDPDPRRHRDPRASRRRAEPPTASEGIRILGAEDDEPEADRFTLPDDEDQFTDRDGPTWSASSQGEVDSRASGEVELPHWTEPPTGEVPRILPDVDPNEDLDDDLDSWRSVSGRTPRYRAGAGDWAESDYTDSLKDDDVALGALAEGPDEEDFEQEIAARRGRGRRTRPSRTDRGGRRELDDDVPPGPVAVPGTPPDLTTRVITGVGIAVVSLLMLAAGRGPATLLVMAIVGLAAFELYVAFQRAGYQPATVLGLLGCVSIVWIGYKEGLHAFPLVSALVVIFTLLWYMAEVVKARPIVNTAVTVLVFMYVGVLGGFAGMLLSAPNGTGLIIGLAICAVGYDVVGFFIGSQFGRSKMAPRLSPNKTWEGLFGGMAAAVVLGGIVSKGLSLAPWDGKLSHGLALGAVVAIMAPVGDLCESMIKRDLGVKDLGTILPGHGGILDRFDAILFCLPAVFYLAIQLEIG